MPRHFFAEADTKKHRYASVKAFNAALVKLTNWIIKNNYMINCACFSASDLNMTEKAMLFDSLQHYFLSLGWRLQRKSLYQPEFMNWNFLLKRYNFFYSYKILYISNTRLLRRENVVCQCVKNHKKLVLNTSTW